MELNGIDESSSSGIFPRHEHWETGCEVIARDSKRFQRTEECFKLAEQLDEKDFFFGQWKSKSRIIWNNKELKVKMNP